MHDLAPVILLAVDALTIGVVVAALVVGAVLGALIEGRLVHRTLASAKEEASEMLRAASVEADAIRQGGELDAERRTAERRRLFDLEIAKGLSEIKESQARAIRREETLDRKLERIGEREAKLERREAALEETEERLETERRAAEDALAEIRRRLGEIAGMTTEEAREAFMAEVRLEAQHEAALEIRQVLERAEADARNRSREITLMAIQRFASEHVADSTVRSIKIPSDDMKGRIIGREGRNIRAIERATGVDILVDDTPGVISVSCFDPIRRAIAAEALTKLVADGRVHPSRVEEIVEQVRRDIGERISKAGADSAVEAGVRGLHPKIVEAMGKLHFRTSYGQNVLRHSIEVAFLSQMIADQLGLNGSIARRAGFLHDIGKAMDHEIEGGHPAIGAEFARKYGEKSDAVLNAIAGHHSDVPATTPYTPIVMAADALSGARPGARRESMEMYIKRLEQLEAIAREQPHVEEAHAIQAGREVRVIIDARKADDTEAFAVARAIAKRIEEEMTFPGEIKVTVLREVRAEATAR
ncbi:MAG TPA: ribonuclease Y [Phycisphaerales bacterium]|nr:ribonuclease Y [Phycisphaerales bacterium]HMP36087.1 ribonuclease Y [Phycisphaerales bacterium]